MKKYKIQIIETLSRIIAVKADSEEEAEMVVQDMYREEEVVLTSEDYDFTTFNYIGDNNDS